MSEVLYHAFKTTFSEYMREFNEKYVRKSKEFRKDFVKTFEDYYNTV